MRGIDSHNPTLPRGDDDPDFAAKLMALVHFPLGKALDLRGMDTRGLLVIRPLLRKDAPRYSHYQCLGKFPSRLEEPST